MKIAVISDVHGNSHAFQAALDAAQAAGAGQVWFLGDLVGYGARPDECAALAASHADVCLAGNHDLAVRGDLSLRDFSPNAAGAARWTQEHIAPATLELLSGLQPSHVIPGTAALYHASPADPVWEYVLSARVAEEGMDVSAEPVTFVGHSHAALAFWRESPDAEVLGALCPEGTVLELAGKEWIINPGSAGQPRDGDPRAAWALLDTDAGTVTFCRAAYDIAAAQEAIRAQRGLPDSLASRLADGS